MMALFRNFKNEVLNIWVFSLVYELEMCKKKNVLCTLQQGSLVQQKKTIFTKFWNDVRNTQHETRCWIFFSFSKLITFCCKLQYIFYHVFYYLFYIKAWNLLSLRLSGLKALGCMSKYHKFHSFFIIVICCLYLLHKWVFWLSINVRPSY